MTQTPTELWSLIDKSKAVFAITRDQLTLSGIKLLTQALERQNLDPGCPDEPIELTELEGYAVENVRAMVEAYETMYFQKL